MPDSKRQKIIDLAVVLMQTIRTANGYQTELGEHVEDWRVNWDDSELPALSVCDTVADENLANNEPSASLQTNRLPLLFRIFVKSDTSAADLRKMIADVKMALKTNLRWNDGTTDLAMWTLPSGSGIVVPTESFEIAGAEIRVEISYLTESFSEF